MADEDKPEHGKPADGSFLRIRFDGGRFRDHAAPVQALGELAIVERLVALTAKHLYFQRHPDRSRTPKNFSEASRLYLGATEANCFTGALLRADDAWVSQDDSDFSIYDEAKDVIFAWIRAAGDGTVPPVPVVEEAERFLSKLGTSLNDDEAVTLGDPRKKDGAEVVVDFRTRARLAKRAGVPFFTDREVQGEIIGLVDEDRLFIVRTDSEALSIVLDPPRRQDVLKALEERPIVVVRVKGRMLVESKRMETVLEVDFDEHPRADDVRRAWARIDGLGADERGWLDGEGEALSASARGWGRELIARLLVSDSRLVRPGIFPTVDGGIQAEWYAEKRSVVLAVPPVDSVCELSAIDLRDSRGSWILPVQARASKDVGPHIAKRIADFLTGASNG